jgi:hypothetical protein
MEAVGGKCEAKSLLFIFKIAEKNSTVCKMIGRSGRERN